MSDPLQQRIQHESVLAELLWQMLADEAVKLGFTSEELLLRPLSELKYRLETDPASGEAALIGEWRDAHGHKVGEMIFHPDGSFFAEHDVVRVHPGNSRLFVEAVTAWGRDAKVNSEPRLLPMVS